MQVNRTNTHWSKSRQRLHWKKGLTQHINGERHDYRLIWTIFMTTRVFFTVLCTFVIMVWRFSTKSWIFVILLCTFLIMSYTFCYVHSLAWYAYLLCIPYVHSWSYIYHVFLFYVIMSISVRYGDAISILCSNIIHKLHVAIGILYFIVYILHYVI